MQKTCNTCQNANYTQGQIGYAEKAKQPLEAAQHKYCKVKRKYIEKLGNCQEYEASN